MINSIVYQAHKYHASRFHAGFGRARSPFGAASLVVAALLSLLFAAAIIAALQPAHLADPALAVLQGGL